MLLCVQRYWGSSYFITPKGAPSRGLHSRGCPDQISCDAGLNSQMQREFDRERDIVRLPTPVQTAPELLTATALYSGI